MRFRTFLCATFLLTLTAGRVEAEESATLSAAEKAYLAVDFESTRDLASRALTGGGHEPRETAGLYTLLGIAQATLGDAEAARRAFEIVLAIDPTSKLDKTLAPKIRAPYLEARGALSSVDSGLSAVLSDGNLGLTLQLSGPIQAARAVELRTRAQGSREFRTARHEPAAEIALSIAVGPSLEYAITVLDEFGNILHRRGSEREPLLLKGKQRSATSLNAPRATKAGPVRSATPYYLTSGVLALLGIGAGSAGVYFHLEREDAAREWNSTACEAPGSSRGQQCAEVDERRELSERLAVGLYAGGTTLLISSLVTLILAPQGRHADEMTASAPPCAPAAGLLGMSCAGYF